MKRDEMIISFLTGAAAAFVLILLVLWGYSRDTEKVIRMQFQIRRNRMRLIDADALYQTIADAGYEYDGMTIDKALELVSGAPN